ncbi:hypothetical protein BJI69_18035 [Luteibacter rhizovicinus DSM 16549]|uniref:Uncharacterized protein n=1 Tax=Luteibacter rhizovicinus DSM 16549 TaxID=1440763 RepID=A0A0G9HB07_9GAMM|nr:hypothetical protein [Luteibacter rhizovicinus]APG05616.1 hypothetical protein BJI69_18035 [Luteibacter rhizovicinus DSM 16549]KLD67000.1 hypothetical protein Y883_10535 [Luteibacter rhizovicinus DSM 16549]KLD73733.1 hypothetical protein Y886_36435 [Xanthomonas hyacinthi DSM 19077]
MDESVIVITRRGLLALQRLNILVAVAARGLRDSPEALPVLLRALGSKQPDDRTAVAIAQLVMSSAMLFLLFHEAAHLLRGHLTGAAAEDEREPQLLAVSSTPTVPAVAPIGWKELNHPNVYSRTIEFDADIQAFYWTRLYLDHIDTTLLSDELGSESQEVFRVLLSTPDGRRWVTLVAGLCFHLAFSAQASRLVQLKDATHPSRHERIELALLSDAAIANHNAEDTPVLRECVDFVCRMICEDESNGGVMEESAQRLTRRPDQSISAYLEGTRVWLGLSLDEVSAEQVHQQRLALMESMRRWEPIFARRQVTSTLPILPWWRVA